MRGLHEVFSYLQGNQSELTMYVCFCIHPWELNAHMYTHKKNETTVLFTRWTTVSQVLVKTFWTLCSRVENGLIRAVFAYMKDKVRKVL